MITQAKLDQAVLERRALGRGPRRTTLFDLLPGGMATLMGPFAFFLDAREAHGLGDLLLAALLRGVRGEGTEPPPRVVAAVAREPDGLVRVETRLSRLWVAFDRVPEGAEAAPDPAKRFNAALVLCAVPPEEPPPAPFVPFAYAHWLEQVRRFLPLYLRAADPHWLQVFSAWLAALEGATGAAPMKDLTDALRFYDRNREKIESLLAFRRELAEENVGFARRIEAKLRAASLGDGLAVEPGGRLSLVRDIRLEGHPYEAQWTAEIRLEELALRTAIALRRDLATRRRPPAEDAARLLEASGLARLAADKRINPENPEALAYQALKPLLQAALDAFAQLAK